jgi:hypothetical protein
MLLIIGGLIVATVILAITKAKSFTNAHPLGWMSEQWLIEHRAAEHR